MLTCSLLQDRTSLEVCWSWIRSLNIHANQSLGTYNATKAALHAYSNTMRLELAPFGVKVVTIMTGRVKSNLARTKRLLPEGSLYLPINDDYQRRVTHSQEDAMPGDAFARSVVSQVLETKKKWIWEGKSSWPVWLMDTFLPKTYMVITVIKTSEEEESSLTVALG